MKKRFSIFGLNKNKNTFELIKFLEHNFGIIVANVLLPNINRKDLENILGYEYAVFFRGREVKAQNIFKLYPIDNFETLIPYSLSEIYFLYKNILDFFKMEGEINKLETIFDKKREKHVHLFDKAQIYTLGFILYDFHIVQFLKDSFRGCSFFSTLKDMGFKLSFFIFAKDNKYENDRDAFINLGNKNDFSIMISDKKGDLDNFIERDDIQIYYSELANDRRILSRNKGQFSIGDFEYGIDGFYRSLEILLRKCEKVVYIRKLLQN